MNYLYSSDNFGTIKEYDINKILNSDESLLDSMNEYSSKPIKRVTFIYSDSKLDFNGKNQIKSEMLIGYSDGSLSVISAPFNNQLNIPKITFMVNGEVIFICDITLNYPDEIENGNKVIIVIAASRKLYLFRLPQVDEDHPYFRSIINFNCRNENDSRITSNFIIETLELPCTNLKCVAYNSKRNSIAIGGYESDIKIFNLNTLKVTWSSKNIQLNMLKHRVPIDVTKLTFIQEDPEILLCGTGYGEIRLYAPQLQRRPIINHEIWEEKLPITGLEIIKMWSKLKSNKNSYGSILAVSNNKGSVVLLSISDTQVDNKKCWSCHMEKRESALNKKKLVPLIREYVSFNISKQLDNSASDNIKNNHRIEISTLGSFKGIMGGVTSIKNLKLNSEETKDNKLIAIGGLGRYIYIFEVKKRRLIKKIFTAQKITFISSLN